jgi:uncharacterized surface protein with fasciclin (FAS1) repeats
LTISTESFNSSSAQATEAMLVPSIALTLALATSAASQATQQSLATGLSPYADLSIFKSILDVFPGFISSVLDGRSSVTVLIPTNQAITNFLAKSNVTDLVQIPVSTLHTVFKYHIMDAALKATNFSKPGGITVPTLLRDSQYNNRTAGAELTKIFGSQATGQVLFVQKDSIPVASKFRVRQSTQGPNANLRGGLAQTGLLTSVDGSWDGGVFQVIDT